MALCGFNEKMLKGLKAFNEGLVEHGLEFRSKKNGENIDQAVKREISDMTRLLLELHRLDESDKKLITQGLVQYAQGFYLLIRKVGIENSQKLIENIGNYFQFMDSTYYKQLEGRADDMQELANKLNQKQIT